MGELRIGCSGWAYRDWKGAFYPAELKDRERLAYYAARFDTAELNASFYRLPTAAAVAAWARAAPEGFLFAWKASREITQYKRLADVDESLATVLDRMSGLAQAQGPTLFQLPPSLQRDDERLDAFAARLPQGRRCAIEFRNASWYAPPVYNVMKAHNLGFVIHDHHYAPSPSVVTADFVYWRGHGPTGRYAGHYSPETLASLAAEMVGWRRDGLDAYGYFNNTMASVAPEDALALKALIAARD